MIEPANTGQNELSVLEGLAAQAQMFACGAAMNLLQLGRVLTEAKPIVPHGEWLQWVRENAHMPARTAQQYMQAYAKFGTDHSIAQLGPAQIIKLLPMSDEERTELLANNDVKNMSTRELDEAIREQKERLKKEAMDEAQEAINSAVSAQREAEARLAELQAKDPEVPQELLDELHKGKEDLDEARNLAKEYAHIADEAERRKAAVEQEKASMQAEIEEANILLKEQQEIINQTQEELLNLKSAQARGTTASINRDELTLDVFAQAVREFVGLCARMPYMATSFAGMSQEEKAGYEELLCTVEGWMEGARQALNCVAAEGGIIIE